MKTYNTERDSDFIAVIENKTNNQICIHYNEPGYYDNYDPILIRSNSWVGIENDEEGRDLVKQSRAIRFPLCTTKLITTRRVVR